MPTPTEFMKRVVPWPAPGEPGFINLHYSVPGPDGTTNKKGGMRGRAYTDISEFMNMAQWGASNPERVTDVYYCLSRQLAHGKTFGKTLTACRLKQNAAYLKAVWIDVDVKPDKGYATLAEAIKAIQEFITNAKLPPATAIVLSGGGVHVYWISDRPLTPAEWTPYAEGLRHLVALHGLKCDAGLTTDAARVLRVPGTFNYKILPKRGVKLAALAANDLDFGKVFNMPTVVAPSVTAAVTGFDLSKFGTPDPSLSFLDPAENDLSAGVHVYEDTPLNPLAAIKGCPHLKNAFKTGGVDCSQGAWMLDVLASTFFQNGRAFAHKLSKGHSGYDPADTDKMFDRKTVDRAERSLGWPSCKAFENEGCQECLTCPLRGHIKSPLSIAPRAVTPPSVPAQVPVVSNDLGLPDGYTLDDRGWICEIIKKTIKDGDETQEIEELAPLFMCKIRFPFAQSAPHRGLNFEVNLDMDVWEPCHIPEAKLATDFTLMMALRDCGVKPYPRNKGRLEQFMTAWMEKLDRAVYRQKSVPFGWLFEHEKRRGFVYGGMAFRDDGTEHPAGYSQQNLRRFYTPRGSIDPWFELHHVIVSQHHPALEAIAASAFAAPLMFIPSCDNGLIAAWSDGGGAHKSTSLYAAASVWGDPKLTKEQPESSMVALMGKLGEIRNLPLYWDEINDKEKMERVRKGLGLFTEGHGPSKMHQNRQIRDQEEWQSLVCIGANCSLREVVISHNKSSDAGLQRVFEFKVEKRPDTQSHDYVDRLRDSLRQNCGQMGLLYASYLGKNHVAIEQEGIQRLDAFKKRVGVLSEERFWTALPFCMIYGAEIANRLGCAFNVQELEDYLIEVYFDQRLNRDRHMPYIGLKYDPDFILTEFFKANEASMWWTADMAIGGAGKPKPLVHLHGPRENDGRSIQVHWMTGPRLMQMSKQAFVKFLDDSKQHSTAVVLPALEEKYKIKSVKLNLAAGSGMKAGGREAVMEFSIPPGCDLEEILFRHTPPDQLPAGNITPSTVAVAPGATGIVDAAVAQAAKDLALVRSTS